MKSMLRVLWFLTAAFFISCSPARFEMNKKATNNPTPQTVNTFSWVISGSWSTCSKPCGGGVQSREVKCQNQDGVTVDATNCSGAAPTATQNCNVDVCSLIPTWNIGDWSACSKSCGGGVRNRTVTCQTSDGGSANENQCPSPKPPTSESCNADACSAPVTYAWSTSAWGACDKECAGGNQTRIVECRGTDGSIVADTSCSGMKPVGTQACNTQACTVNYSYAWDTGDWTTCSSMCGGGLQVRSVFCKRSDNAAVPETLCTAASRPSWNQACNTDPCTVPTRDVTTTVPSNPSQYQVDIMLVVDDSTSMLQDNAKLASRLNGFVNSLGSTGIDWRMCVTSTRTNYYEGRSILWVGTGSHVLTAATPDRSTVFANTMSAIGADWVDSGDEQGIKAMNMHLARRGVSGCYREKAALAVIVISDEDERSVGGNAGLDPAQYKPLENDNQPTQYLVNVAAAFNKPDFTKPISVNSIIVKPGDSSCKADQDAQGTPSYYGTKYKELSDLTQGYVGSICDADYSTSLSYFKEVIYESLSKVTLECNPVGAPTVTVNPPFTTSSSINGTIMSFNPILPAGSAVTVQYKCPL